jgi:hypothetical protein
MTDDQIMILLAEWGLVEYSIAEIDMINFVRSIREQALEEAAKVCEEWSASIDTGPRRNRVVTAAMQGALTCAFGIRTVATGANHG